MNLSNINDLVNIFHMNKETVIELTNVDFYMSYKYYFKYPDMILVNVNEIRELLTKINEGKKSNLKLLDAGCGYGLECLMISLLTDNFSSIIGIDQNEEKIRVAKNLANNLNINNVNFKHLNVENFKLMSNIDVILCRDVVSHVKDITKFFNYVVKLVKAKGLIYIIDDRSIINPKSIIKAKLIQKKVDEKYNILRKEIIKREFNDYKQEKIEHYSRLTAGLTSADIIAFITSVEKGKKNKLPKFKYVNPITGEYCEKLRNPFFIKKKLEEVGLYAKIEKPIYGCSKDHKYLNKIMTLLIKRFHPLSIIIADRYYIKAKKTK